MKYIIYKTTCLVNNKIYIGKHKTNKLADSYLGSGSILKLAIEKYGKDKFKREILFECLSEDEANRLEAEIVDEVFIARLDTYNIMLGGAGGFTYINSTRQNIYKGHDKQCKSAIKLAQQAATKKINELKKDKKLYNEYKQKISNSVKLFYKHGGKNGFAGKTHTNKTKKILSEKSSIHQKGTGNSQYGTCWIYSDDSRQTIKIKKNELTSYINNGWIKGRKLNF